MRYSFLAVLAPFLLGTSLALHIDNAGALLARGDNTTAEIMPFQGSPLRNAKGDEISKREPSMIKGLLQIRQSCPSGYGLCSNNKCCPLGGECCSRGCCDPGEWCYSSGCCKLSETGCEQVTCCPSGTHCCKGGGCCGTSDYCVSGGCCPIGKICVGSGGGGGGGGGGATTRESPTTTRTTHASPTTTSTTHMTATTTSTSTTDLPDISITSSSSSALSPSRTQSSRPTAGAGQVSVTYGVKDTRITWSAGWIDVSSNCTTNARRTTVARESFTVMVASASRIYLNIDVVSVAYNVYVNNLLTPPDFDTFLETNSCAYTALSLGGRTTNINVTVVVVGLPPSNGRKRQFSNDWSFQLNEILAFDSEENSNSNSDSNSNSASGLPSEAAASFKVTSFQIIVAVLLVALGSFW